MKKKFVIFTMSKKKKQWYIFFLIDMELCIYIFMFCFTKIPKIHANCFLRDKWTKIRICNLLFFLIFFFYNSKQYFNLIIPLRAIIMRNIQNTQYKFKVISSNITWNEVCFSLTYEELLTLKNDNNPLLKVLVYIPCLKLSLYIYI